MISASRSLYLTHDVHVTTLRSCSSKFSLPFLSVTWLALWLAHVFAVSSSWLSSSYDVASAIATAWSSVVDGGTIGCCRPLFSWAFWEHGRKQELELLGRFYLLFWHRVGWWCSCWAVVWCHCWNGLLSTCLGLYCLEYWRGHASLSLYEKKLLLDLCCTRSNTIYCCQLSLWASLTLRL